MARLTSLDDNSIFALKSDRYVTAILKEDYDAMSLADHEARIKLEWADVKSRQSKRHAEDIADAA